MLGEQFLIVGHAVSAIILNPFINIVYSKYHSKLFLNSLSDYSSLQIEKRGPLTIINFNRPKKYNAINPEMYKEIAAALKFEASCPESSMCLLTGSGKYYSSGNDLSAFAVALGEGMSPPELADMAFV